MDFLVGSIAQSLAGGIGEAVSVVAGVGEVRDVFASNNAGEDHIQLALAPAYGSLNSEAIKKMDENTKVMIGTTVTMLNAMNPNDRTWKNVVVAMKNSSLLEPVNDDGIRRSDRLAKSGSSYFKFDGSPDPGIVNEIVVWFTNLIADDDIIKTMKVDIQELARIVAQTGATVDGVDSFIYRNQSQHRNVLDMGAIRYPDLSNPYFKIYRIQVDAWSNSERIVFHQEDNNGIDGDFNCWQFRPRPEQIANLREEVRELAVKAAEELFT